MKPKEDISHLTPAQQKQVERNREATAEKNKKVKQEAEETGGKMKKSGKLSRM